MPKTRSRSSSPQAAGSSRPLGFAPPKPPPLKSVAPEASAPGNALVGKGGKISGATRRPTPRERAQDQDEKEVEDDEEYSSSFEGEEEDPPDDSDVDKLGSPRTEQATDRPRAALASHSATPIPSSEATRPADQVSPAFEGRAGTSKDAQRDEVPMETDVGEEDELGDDSDDAGEAPNARTYSEQSTYGEDSTSAGAAYSGRNATLDKPFGCSDPACDRAFARRSDLLRHFRIHSDDKPFQCQHCDKRFIQRSALIVHIRTHTGERPHVCEVCKSRFADSSSLARHRRIHTGVRPYACKHCSKTYCRKSTLARHHQKMHHPQRFALEHEAAKAKQAAILERRRNGLEQRVDSQRSDQRFTQYQLPDPVDMRQRRPLDGGFAMDTSHDARAEYSDSAYPTFTWPRASMPTEARAPRYALDAFGRAYEVDEYGNSVARELVQFDLAPLRDSRSSTSGGAPRLPSPFQYGFGHSNTSRSLYSGQHHSAPIAHQYSFSEGETHVLQEYDPRHPLLSQDGGTVYHPSGRSASHGRAHSSDDRGINLPSSNVEWQPATSMQSAYSQVHHTPYLAPSDSPVRLPPTPGMTDFHGPRGSQAGTSATLSHTHGQNDGSPALPPQIPTLRDGAPLPEGTKWLRSRPGGQLVQNPTAEASAPLPPRDPNPLPSRHRVSDHDRIELAPPLMPQSGPPSGPASSAIPSPKATVHRTSLSSGDHDPGSSPVHVRHTMAYSSVNSPPDRPETPRLCSNVTQQSNPNPPPSA